MGESIAQLCLVWGFWGEWGYLLCFDEEEVDQMKLTANHDKKTFEIVDDLPDIGWYVYAYDSSGKNTHDYLQDDLDMAMSCAFHEFGVPYNAWNTDDLVQCCLCGQLLYFNDSLRIKLDWGKRPFSRTLFGHRNCFLEKIHFSVNIPEDLHLK